MPGQPSNVFRLRTRLPTGPEYPAIDWSMIGQATEFYRQRGFDYIELPWLVPKQEPFHAPEEPVSAKTLQTDRDLFVATPEQGFIHWDSLRADDLSEGRFVGCAPSLMGWEDGSYDHNAVEVGLYQTDAVDEIALSGLVETVAEFLRYHLPDPTRLVRDRDERGWVLSVSGIVVAVFGSGSHGMLNWIYGSGLIEPNFSRARRACLPSPE